MALSQAPKPLLSPLYLACLRGNYIMIRSILTTKCDIGIMSPPTSAATRTELRRTPTAATDNLIRYIINQSTTLALHDGSPLKWSTMLHYAIESGNHVLLEEAIQSEVDIEMVDCYGRTALHVAAWKDDTRATQILLDAGANVLAMSKWGRTPLVDARRLYLSTRAKESRAKSGNPMCISAGVIWMLLEKEDFDYCDVDECSLLQLAARYEHVALMKQLLVFGVDANIHDCHGRTALHDAAKKANPEAVLLLLGHGADQGIVDNYGRRAVNILPETGNLAGLEAMKGMLTVGLRCK